MFDLCIDTKVSDDYDFGKKYLISDLVHLYLLLYVFNYFSQYAFKAVYTMGGVNEVRIPYTKGRNIQLLYTRSKFGI